MFFLNKKFFIFLMIFVSFSAIASVAADDVTELSDVEDEPPSVNLSTSNSYLEANDVDMTYHDGSRYYVSLHGNNGDLSDKQILISINNKTYNKTTDSNGIASLALNLDSGKYNITSSYGDYMVSNNVFIKSTIDGQDILKTYKNGTQFYSTFKDSNGKLLSNQTVSFNINGVFYNKVTNNDGVARLNINLQPGSYIITCSNPVSGEMSSNVVRVLSTISGSDLVKVYRNGSAYCAKFLDSSGAPLKGQNVSFNINGVFYNKVTGSDGVARLNINLQPGSYIITCSNPVSGEMSSNVVRVLSTISGSDLVKVYRNGSAYCAKFLDSSGAPLKCQNVSFNINGVFYSRVTGSDGVASLNINLQPGSYIITCINPLNGEKSSNIVKIIAPLTSHDLTFKFGDCAFLNATLIGSNGNPISDITITFIINDNKYTAKTNSKGIASLDLDFLSGGNYTVNIIDPITGYSITQNVVVTLDSLFDLHFNKFGISDDGTMILAIGRPSVNAELSEFGYTYNKAIFSRICPYCGSNDLVWGMFWNGESNEGGIFPNAIDGCTHNYVYGHYESGALEGHIFCAHCDADFSCLIGKDHSTNDVYLTKLTDTVSSSKDEVYILNTGNWNN